MAEDQVVNDAKQREEKVKKQEAERVQQEKQQESILQKVLNFIRKLFGAKPLAAGRPAVEATNGNNPEAAVKAAMAGAKSEGKTPGAGLNGPSQNDQASPKQASGEPKKDGHEPAKTSSGYAPPQQMSPKERDALYGKRDDAHQSGNQHKFTVNKHRSLMEAAKTIKEESAGAPVNGGGRNGPGEEVENTVTREALVQGAIEAQNLGWDSAAGLAFRQDLRDVINTPSESMDEEMKRQSVEDAYFAKVLLDNIDSLPSGAVSDSHAKEIEQRLMEQRGKGLDVFTNNADLDTAHERLRWNIEMNHHQAVHGGNDATPSKATAQPQHKRPVKTPGV